MYEIGYYKIVESLEDFYAYYDKNRKRFCNREFRFDPEKETFPLILEITIDSYGDLSLFISICPDQQKTKQEIIQQIIDKKRYLKQLAEDLQSLEIPEEEKMFFTYTSAWHRTTNELKILQIEAIKSANYEAMKMKSREMQEAYQNQIEGDYYVSTSFFYTEEERDKALRELLAV